MKKINAVAVLGLVVLAGCMPRHLAQAPMVTPVAAPMAPVPAADDPALIAGRVLQQINTLRANIGVAALSPSPQLDAAAMAHSRDMSAQNRAWHWGSDGSSPLDRAKRQGYGGTIIGETISESYENDMQTLAAWMSTRDTRDVIMDPAATQLGVAFFTEPSGKIWWTLLTGS